MQQKEQSVNYMQLPLAKMLSTEAIAMRMQLLKVLSISQVGKCFKRYFTKIILKERLPYWKAFFVFLPQNQLFDQLFIQFPIEKFYNFFFSITQFLAQNGGGKLHKKRVPIQFYVRGVF